MSTPPPRLARLALTRRSALGVLLAGAVGTACEPMTVEQEPVSRPSAAPSGDAVRELDPDVSLAAAALATEQRMLDLVERTLDRHRSLRGTLSGARTTHHRHVRLLTDAVPEEARPKAARAGDRAARVPSRPDQALARIAQREDQLGRDTKATAFAAQSGPFARLLASMAAAAQQQAVTLRAATGSEVGR